jgi:Tfp pilus assembly protein PilF
VAPTDPTVHQWYGLMLAYVGRTHEAAVQTGEASRLDPLSVQINNMYGMMLFHDGDVAGALRQFERTVVAEPDSAWVRQNPWVLDNYGVVVAAAGRPAEGRRLIERALVVVPSHPRALLDLAETYILMEKRDSARAVFARVDTTHPHYPIYRAELHALLGETDSAFAELDRVQEWALPSLVGLNSSQSFAALRADPRYARIRERMGMPPR